MNYKHTLYLAACLSAPIYLSGCAAAPIMAAGYATNYVVSKGIESERNKEKRPESIVLTEDQDFIKVSIDTKLGGLLRNNQNDTKWAKSAAIVKAEQMGCAKIRYIPDVDHKVGVSPLGGLTGHKTKITTMYKCIRDKNDYNGEDLADQLIIYKDFIEAIKQDSLVQEG